MGERNSLKASMKNGVLKIMVPRRIVWRFCQQNPMRTLADYERGFVLREPVQCGAMKPLTCHQDALLWENILEKGRRVGL